jgi:hypothetical protein
MMDNSGSRRQDPNQLGGTEPSSDEIQISEGETERPEQRDAAAELAGNLAIGAEANNSPPSTGENHQRWQSLISTSVLDGMVRDVLSSLKLSELEGLSLEGVTKRIAQAFEPSPSNPHDIRELQRLVADAW